METMSYTMEKKISLSRLSKENSHSNQCILCRDGGGNLYSCKRNLCGKVYHIECYDPTNNREPPDYWRCLLCFSKDEFQAMSNESDKYGNMGERDFKLCFRLMLELKSCWPISRTFEPSETLESTEYRNLIHYPVAMDVIQQRLNRSKGDNKYFNCTQFMTEVRRMFSNCRTFWSVNTSNSHSSGMYMRHADKLEAFFDEKLQEWEKHFSTYIDDADRPIKPHKKIDRNAPKPEPYVPSFMLLNSPEKGDNPFEKPKKCFVCQKFGSDASPTYKCALKCKRSYHANCYVPALKKDPPKDWNCIMCVKVDDLAEQPNEPNREGGKLGKRDYLICSRLFLELHKIWPDCKTFMQMAALDFSLYRSVIKHPIALDLIRKRMDRKYPLQYESVNEFLKDVRLMFRNCKSFWKGQEAGEKFLQHADNLKAHLDKTLLLLQPVIDEKPDSKIDKNNNKISKISKEEKPLKSRKAEESEDEQYSRPRRSETIEEEEEDLPLKSRRPEPKRIEEDEDVSRRFSRRPGPKSRAEDRDVSPEAPRRPGPKSRAEDRDDSPELPRRPGPKSKRNLFKKPVSKAEDNSDVDEEISLSTMKLNLSKSSNPKEEPKTRRPGPASFKAKLTPSSRKEREKQKDSEIRKDTVAESLAEILSTEAFETYPEKTFETEYKCNYCNAVYNKLSKMQDHTLSHFEEKLSDLLPHSKPHLCPTCDSKSADNDALMRHYAFDCESVNETQESIRKNLTKS